MAMSIGYFDEQGPPELCELHPEPTLPLHELHLSHNLVALLPVLLHAIPLLNPPVLLIIRQICYLIPDQIQVVHLIILDQQQLIILEVQLLLQRLQGGVYRLDDVVH